MPTGHKNGKISIKVMKVAILFAISYALVEFLLKTGSHVIFIKFGRIFPHILVLLKIATPWLTSVAGHN